MNNEYTRNEVFRMCLKRYKNAYIQMMDNSSKRTKYHLFESKIEGILQLSGDLLGFPWEEIGEDFGRCDAFVDLTDPDVILVPADIADKYGLNDMKGGINGK